VDGGAKIVGIAEGGSAALHGGLEVGQVFCSVNGESSAGKSVAELVLMVTGEPGSECTLELQDARGINQSVTIVRNVNMPLDLDRLVIAQERTCTTPEGRVQAEAPLC
jgi:C-terminal processing protease CtpA/Prc